MRYPWVEYLADYAPARIIAVLAPASDQAKQL